MDPKDADRILRALASVYVWVASADGHVSRTELVKFEHALLGSPFATHFEPENAKRYFHDMVAAFQDDFESAARLTEDRLVAVKEFPTASEEVVRFARAAAVGDRRSTEGEERVLPRLQKLLGLKTMV